MLNSFPRSQSWLQSKLASCSNSFCNLSAQDIQQAASQLAETAVATIKMIQQSVSHDLLKWVDAQQAP